MRYDSARLYWKIRHILHQHPKGIWISRVARLVRQDEEFKTIDRTTVLYYILGKKVKGKLLGGFLKDDIVVKREWGSYPKVKLLQYEDAEENKE